MMFELHRKKTFAFLLVFAGALSAEVVQSNDFDIAEEDRILNGLQSGNINHQTDPKFVAFLTDVGSRLTLPQTYDSAISDFVLAIKNDHKWLEDSILRKAITGLCRKIAFSCTVDSLHLAEVYTMLEDVTVKFPVAERYRLLSFMNRLDGLRQRQLDSAEKIQQKIDADAAKESEKQKVLAEKLAAKEAAEAAKAAVVEKEKVQKTPKVRTSRQKTTTAQESSKSADTLPEEQKSVMPRKPRGRARKVAVEGGVEVAEEQVQNAGSSTERFERPHTVFVSGSNEQNVQAAQDEQGVDAQ